jgi:hypothetical protein
MRNILLSLIFLLAAQSVQAQSNQLTQIRKIYADAKKKIEINGKNGNPRNDLQIINHDQERKGTMEEEEDVRFFYQWIDGERKLYFATQKIEKGDFDIYREWLFNTSDGALLFAYQKQEQNEGKPLETRCYWWDYNLIDTKTNDKNPDADHPSILYRLGQQFSNIFEALMTRDL